MKWIFGDKMQQAAAHQPALKHNFRLDDVVSSRCMTQIHFVDVLGGQITVLFTSHKEPMIDFSRCNWQRLIAATQQLLKLDQPRGGIILILH